MIEPPVISQREAQTVACVHLVIAKDRMQQEMGPGIGEIMSALSAQGVTPSGPWMAHHLHMNDTTWDFEICVPVPHPITPTGRVENREMAAVSAIHTVYHGGYERLGDAWSEFMASIGEHGHSLTEDFMEVYAVGPESSQDPAAWRTELIRPLASA